MKLVLCIWLGINRSNKLIHSFQVGVARCSQNDSKQWVRMNLSMKLIRMNLVIKLFFCIWLGIHKHIYLIHYIHMDEARHTWLSKSTSQYWICDMQGPNWKNQDSIWEKMAKEHFLFKKKSIKTFTNPYSVSLFYIKIIFCIFFAKVGSIRLTET